MFSEVRALVEISTRTIHRVVNEPFISKRGIEKEDKKDQ